MSFVTYDVSLELVSVLRPIVARLTGLDPKLADQVRRAASSVALLCGAPHISAYAERMIMRRRSLRKKNGSRGHGCGLRIIGRPSERLWSEAMSASGGLKRPGRSVGGVAAASISFFSIGLACR